MFAAMQCDNVSVVYLLLKKKDNIVAPMILFQSCKILPASMCVSLLCSVCAV